MTSITSSRVIPAELYILASGLQYSRCSLETNEPAYITTSALSNKSLPLTVIKSTAPGPAPIK